MMCEEQTNGIETLSRSKLELRTHLVVRYDFFTIDNFFRHHSEAKKSINEKISKQLLSNSVFAQKIKKE